MVSQEKIGGDFEVLITAIDCQHHLEGIFNFRNFQRFLDASQGGGIHRLEADVDIGIVCGFVAILFRYTLSGFFQPGTMNPLAQTRLYVAQLFRFINWNLTRTVL